MKKSGGLFGLFGKKTTNAPETVEQPAQALSMETDEEVLPLTFDSVDQLREDVLITADGEAMEKLLQLYYMEAYVPNLVFESKDKVLELSANKESEMGRLSDWVKVATTEHLKHVMEATDNAHKDKKSGVVDAVSHSTDGRAFLYTSTDNLACWLIVFPPFGKGVPVSIDYISSLLSEQKIKFGVNDEYINKIFTEKLYFHLYPIVNGVAPVDGEDGYVNEFYSKDSTANYTPNMDGIIDYKSITYFQPIFAGDAICEIIKPTDGLVGTDIRGEKILPKGGKPAKVYPGKNTQINDTKTLLSADIDGDVVFSRGRFSVRDAMIIEGDVDYSTGNINFMGDVHVKGNIRDKFIVRSTGSVVIDGVLESGVVDADGDVIISGGILGNEHGTIRSRGNVRAKFMENCKVFVSGSLYTDYAMSCNIHCDGPLIVTSGKGVIIGGEISVATYVEAKTLGAPNGGIKSTILNMGVEPCEGGDAVSSLDFKSAFEDSESFAEWQDLNNFSFLEEFIDQPDEPETPETPEAPPVNPNMEMTESALGCRGKFFTINTGVHITYENQSLTVTQRQMGVGVRYNAKDCEIIIS